MGIMIAGISSGAGKTTCTIGLMRAFAERGYKVGAFKAGPDYIDPMFHKMAIREASYNLPAWMVDDHTLKYLYNKRSMGKDICIVEGVMGYFDGHDTTSILGSSAHLAETLNLDVIIVMDGSSMALTAAAIVEGLLRFHEPTRIKGIIFNRIKSENHYSILKTAVESHTGIKCYGYMKPSIDVELESRHLGLVQAMEDGNAEGKIQKMAKLVEQTVLLDEIYEDFAYAVDQSLEPMYDVKVSSLSQKVNQLGRFSIGVALDDAFSFYYEENLKLLEEIGLVLKPFSPLYDSRLPDGIDALYIGGGYPEVFAKALSDNSEMRLAILSAAKEGLPIYAECGGLMYLMSEIVDIEGHSFEMVAHFSGRAIMTDKLQRFGHVEATLPNGLIYKGHEFHHSTIENESSNCLISVTNKRNKWSCGYHKNNVIGTYVHNHFYSNLDFVEFLINFFKAGKT